MKRLSIILCLVLWSRLLYASTLSDAAAALAPGQWTTITTTNINTVFLNSGGNTNRINPFAESLKWDPVGNKLYFNGADHNSLPGRLAIYDDATNSWSSVTMPSWGNHGYDHIAINPTSREVIFHEYFSTLFHRYSLTSSSFISDLPSPISLAQVAGGIDYFPERNELFWVDGDWGSWRYSFSAATWSRVSYGNGGGGTPATPMGPYHNFAEYNPVKQVIVFGGGNGSQKLYQYNASGVVSNLPDAPVEVGIQRSIFTVDPATGDFLVFSITGDSFRSYNVTSGVWTLQSTAPIFTGSVNSPTIDGVIGGPIAEYGVVVFVDCTTSNCDFRIYKHGTTGPDSEPPSTPGSLSAVTTSATNINLSWTASTDNVVVSGYRLERCTGTGCSGYSEISQPSIPSYSNSGVSSGTTIYRYRVRAVDTSNNFSGYSTPVESTLFTGSGNFTERCAAAGVVRCWDFDDTGDFSTGVGGTQGAWGSNFGILPPSGTSDYTRATRDTTISASGASSLKFTIPTNTGADSSGSWFTNFSSNLATQFGSGQTFYIQWRQRFSPCFIRTGNNDTECLASSTPRAFVGGGGWKQSIIGRGDPAAGTCTSGATATCSSSCTDTEVVTQNTFHRGAIQMYHSCVGCDGASPFSGFEEPFGASDFKLQNGYSGFCPYSQVSTGNLSNCIPYYINEWMTFKVRITLGTWDGNSYPNSTVEQWIGRAGQASIKTQSYVTSINAKNLCNGSSSESYKYGKIWLLPYNTSKDSSAAHPTAFTWYDDLIISTQNIADPSDVEGGSLVPTISQKRRRK